MGCFMTRVELHGGTAADYEKLHEAMRLQGFSRNIKGSSGRLLRLPTAQYHLESSKLNRSQVHKKAVLAAVTIGKDFAILVTNGPSTFSGLKEVTKAATVKNASPSLAQLARMTKKMP